MVRNDRSRSSGIRGHVPPESSVTFARNPRSRWSGIRTLSLDGMGTLAQSFEREGYAVVEAAVSADDLVHVEAQLDALPLDRAGTRNLLNLSWCQRLVGALRECDPVASLLPRGAVAIQCTLFEKSHSRNWLVPLHQDVHIPVQERIEHRSLTGWSEKEGILYVLPPPEVLEALVAVRVHIHACTSANGPLRVVPGSHRHGRLSESSVAAARSESSEKVCLVVAGGALVMKPLLLHASSKATKPSLRRVLHFLFGPRDLPYGLRYAHAV